MKEQTLQARCAAAVGNKPAATLLLMHIYHWMPRAQVERNGKRWIAKSRAGWCNETGFTLKQYITAITRLRQTGLVETEQHLFGEGDKSVRSIRSITFLRLTDQGAALLYGDKAAERMSGL